MMCCSSNKVIKSDTSSFLALGGLHKDKLCDFLQAKAPTNTKRFIKLPYFISRATSIDSDCCRLPTASILSNKEDKSRSNPFYPKFLKAAQHTDIRNIEIPKSTVVKALSW